MALTQEELLRQQQEKLAGIAQQQQMAQQRTPGQVVGETPEQFAAGKAAANSQAAGYNLFQQRQTVAAKPQPTQQPQPVVQQTAPVKTTPVVDPNSATSGMDAVIANMYTSPEQEEKMRKASVANQRILAIGDALRHIGNIYNTVNYAPSQQFNKPWEEEQTRYEKGKAVRDKANQTYLAYQQAKAAQDAKARQWAAEQETKERQFRYNAAKDAALLAEKKRANDLANALGIRKADDAKANAEADRELRDKISRRSTGLGYANLKQRKEEFNYKKQNGGTGRKLPEILRGKKGWYTKNMGTNELNSFYNQTYKEMKDRGYIDEGRVLANLPADIFGKKSLSQSAIKQAVDNALMQHPEVGDWLENEFEFSFDPRAYDEPQTQQSSGMNGWVAPGNSWSAPKGDPFGERQNSGNTEKDHRNNPFG